MVTRIRKGVRTHLYIEEHILAKNLTYDIVGNRLDVSRTTVWRWAKEQWRLDPDKMAALAAAIGLASPADFYRLPERPSIDAIMADAPPAQYEAVVDLARKLRQAS